MLVSLVEVHLEKSKDTEPRCEICFTSGLESFTDLLQEGLGKGKVRRKNLVRSQLNQHSSSLNIIFVAIQHPTYKIWRMFVVTYKCFQETMARFMRQLK